ncbi:MAG: protein phosphatase 2C domain-containing protein, partial [Myxococcota bacterium]
MDHSWGYGSEQRLREKNEDCYGVFDFPEYTLAVVCDGMGGHVGGAHASTLAVRTIHDTMRELQGRPPAAALEEAVQRTNLVIYEAARKNHRLTGMGTTVVAAVVMRDSCVLAHVGDSRAYLVRRGAVQLLTRDHTMVNLFVDAELLSPEDAATHPEAHVLSRSLGVERQVEVELSDAIQLEAGDVLFLCSDGVHGVVTDWELGNVDWSQPQEATRDVLKIVGSREGDDNATAVSVMMGSTFEDVPPTAVPEPRRYDEYAGTGGSGMTAVPLDDDNEPPEPGLAHTPFGSGSQGGSRSAGSSGYAVYDAPILEPEDDDRRPPEPQRAALPAPIANRDATPQAAAPERKAKPAQPSKPKPAAPKPRSRGMWPAVVVALGLTGVVLLTLMLAVVLWVKVRSGGGPGGAVAVTPDPGVQPANVPGAADPAPPPP